MKVKTDLVFCHFSASVEYIFLQYFSPPKPTVNQMQQLKCFVISLLFFLQLKFLCTEGSHQMLI